MSKLEVADTDAFEARVHFMISMLKLSNRSVDGIGELKMLSLVWGSLNHLNHWIIRIASESGLLLWYQHCYKIILVSGL